MRKILLLAVALVGVLGIAVVAFTASGPGGPPAPPPPPPPPVAALTYAPALDGTDASPTSTATVEVRDGRLDEVTLTDADGKAVPGDFNAERTSWSSTERLDYAGRYTWGGKATGTDGQQVPLAGTFGTVTPKNISAAAICCWQISRPPCVRETKSD